jgi:hypothetical protein
MKRMIAALAVALLPAGIFAQDGSVCQVARDGQIWCLKSSIPNPADDRFLGYSVHGIVAFVIAVALLVIAASTVWSLAIGPRWAVWKAHQEGLADLAQAKNEQQIQIAQAQSRLNAADLNKKAAIIEAEAVSAQIKEIGDQLTSHDLYLRWQWIKMMEDNETDKVIYVPTEANLPILEASRRA